MWGFFRSLGMANKIGVVGAIAGFTVGMVAVIIVDPVVGAFIVAGCVALLLFCMWFFFGPEIRRQHLLTKGVAATATILAVEETGITVQGNYPMAKFRFEVHPASGEEPYEVTAKCLVNRFEVPAFQPGATVRVLVDPKDRHKVVLA
jgi:Protein of unknown function (DUF3592)